MRRINSHINSYLINRRRIHPIDEFLWNSFNTIPSFYELESGLENTTFRFWDCTSKSSNLVPTRNESNGIYTLSFDIPAGTTPSMIMQSPSTIKLIGDFAFYIPFNWLTLASTNSACIGLRVWQSGTYFSSVYHGYTSTSKRYIMDRFNPSGGVVANVTTTDTSGYLRFTRSGNNFVTYRGSPTSWTSLGTYNWGSAPAVYLSVYGGLWDSKPAAKALTGDVFFESGQFVYV